MAGEDEREDQSIEAEDSNGGPAPAPSQGADGARRTDAAGYDVAPPPSPPRPAGQNPGLATEDSPERMDFREFGADAAWTDDTPAPDALEADANPAAAEGVALRLGDDPGEGTEIEARGDDLIEAVTRAIEEVELLDLWDVSVETRGDTVILRGSAATPEDRDRAAELAGAVRGVARVENLISAGPAHGA